jgi:hypothetical protein
MCVHCGPSHSSWVVPHSLCGDVASSTCDPPCEQWLTAVGAGAGFYMWWGAVALSFVPPISPPLVGVHLYGVVTRPLAPANHPASSGLQVWGRVLGCRSAGGGLVGGWWLWMVTWRGFALWVMVVTWRCGCIVGCGCIAGGGGDVVVLSVVAWLHCRWWWDSVVGRSVVWRISVVGALL